MSERMMFCLGEGKYERSGEGYQKNNRIFNTDVTSEQFETAQNTRPEFELPIAKWINKEDMTADEKELPTYWEATGGYLKILSCQDAWQEGWVKASSEFKLWVKNLPHFDSELFEKITSVKFEDDSLSGTEVSVIIKGKTYTAVLK